MAEATERVVILMTKPEKRALQAKAKRAGTSTAELIRRSVKSFDPNDDNAEIEKLLGYLTEAHRKTLASLDKAEGELAETRAYFAAKAREQVA